MTPRLDLNLASRPFRNNTLVWVGHVLAVALVVAATTYNLSNFAHYRAGLRDLKGNVASIDKRMRELDRRDTDADRGIARHDIGELTVQASMANHVIQRKALSWTLLFNRIEKILPYNVRMDSIRPVFASRRTGQDEVPEGSVPVVVEGAAKDLDAFFALLTVLLEDPYFDRVEPERFENASGEEVVFDLRFLYYPEGKAGEEEAEEGSPAAEVASADDAGDEPAPGEKEDEQEEEAEDDEAEDEEEPAPETAPRAAAEGAKEAPAVAESDETEAKGPADEAEVEGPTRAADGRTAEASEPAGERPRPGDETEEPLDPEEAEAARIRAEAIAEGLEDKDDFDRTGRVRRLAGEGEADSGDREEAP